MSSANRVNPNIVIEPEELVEPESQPVGNGRVGRVRGRLSQYGNRVLQSGRNFVTTLEEAASNMATALAGSLLVLPFTILWRGLNVLADTLFSNFKPLVLSFFRAIFDFLRLLVAPVRAVFTGYNKRVLYPLLKRIKEDDAAAVIALIVLVALAVGIYLAARSLIL